MNVDELRTELEEDLSWRLDEIRYLRNALLGSLSQEAWPVSAMRSILVMQYAHLEGYARNAFSVYVTTVNSLRLKADEIHPHLFASALVPEFDALRLGVGMEPESEDGRLTRRAKTQVDFVQKVRDLSQSVCFIDVESAASMEMNFGSDVFRRTLYRLGIRETEVAKTYYRSLEFVRTMRNDIAHGSRRERIHPGEFEAHRSRCEQFMNELTRLITSAVAQEWFRAENAIQADGSTPEHSSTTQ